MKIQKILHVSVIASIMAAIIVLFACEKEQVVGLPEVTTLSVTEITENSALCQGNISHDGGGEIITRGVVWSTTANPTIEINDGMTQDGSGIGLFASNLTGLSDNTEYYVKAYATNSAGTVYGSALPFTTLEVVDADGNVYSTVVIGNQEWFAENLSTTKYRNGTDIPNVTNNSSWAGLSTPAYCWYNNDQSTYGNTYGALYNWYAVNTGNLCPTGWRVPTNADWTTLINYAGGESIAGGKLKEVGTTHWASPNTGATDEYGFSALPGGGRFGISSGTFHSVGYYGQWWSSSEYDATYALLRYIHFDYGSVDRYIGFKSSGYSVRCVRDID